MIRRGTARLCAELGWAVVHEMGLPDGRRADIMALRPTGGLVCIEIKSGEMDFRLDAKWQAYRAFCDGLYFAVDADFPQAVLPPDVGLIVAEETACVIRDAVEHRLAPATRRVLTLQFARLAAQRLWALQDPAGAAALQAALRVE